MAQKFSKILKISQIYVVIFYTRHFSQKKGHFSQKFSKFSPHFSQMCSFLQKEAHLRKISWPKNSQKFSKFLKFMLLSFIQDIFLKKKTIFLKSSQILFPTFFSNVLLSAERSTFEKNKLAQKILKNSQIFSNLCCYLLYKTFFSKKGHFSQKFSNFFPTFFSNVLLSAERSTFEKNKLAQKFSKILKISQIFVVIFYTRHFSQKKAIFLKSSQIFSPHFSQCSFLQKEAHLRKISWPKKSQKFSNFLKFMLLSLIQDIFLKKNNVQ